MQWIQYIHVIIKDNSLLLNWYFGVLSSIFNIIHFALWSDILVVNFVCWISVPNYLKQGEANFGIII